MDYRKKEYKELADKIADVIYEEIILNEEVRNLKVTFRTKPRIQRKLKKEAYKKGISVSGLLNMILEERYK